MRILFILEYFHPHIGGVETLFKSLTENLVKKGFKVTVLTQRHDKNLPSRATENGVDIIRLSISNRYLFTVLAFFPAWLQSFKHDLIHTTSYNAGIPAFFAGLFSGKKVIITFHEVWGQLWMKLPFFSRLSLKGHYFFEQILLKFPFYKYIAVSDFTKNSLIQNGIPARKIVRIYNGLDYTDFEKLADVSMPKKETSFYEFLYFGRLGISKGLDILLEGAHEFYKTKKGFKLTLILPKEPEVLLDKVKKLIKEYELSEVVSLVHSLPRVDLLNRIKAADTVIIPSYSEGFGYTAAESVALGKNVISSQQGALNEVISGSFIHFEPFNAEGLSNAMKKAIENQFTQTAVRKFEFDDTIKEYLDLYEQLNQNLS